MWTRTPSSGSEGGERATVVRGLRNGDRACSCLETRRSAPQWESE
ncbi:hypothetical protein E2C01_096868 [Portunus trituberculatus]|uniref:Uncharacterized protein n=1 Tax=Portunus trituberculatus TaxID=210409 RepID=A0A5B7K358_PORTR|nr:hypothetical protein [Portunus trituberculatus]